MNQRIRYRTVKPGLLMSRRNFTTQTGQEVVVELNLETRQYRVLDSVSGDVVATGGNTRNKSVLKIQAKQGLTALGVSFAEETRTRQGDTPVAQQIVG